MSTPAYNALAASPPDDDPFDGIVYRDHELLGLEFDSLIESGWAGAVAGVVRATPAG